MKKSELSQTIKKDILSISLKITKEKQKIAEECFKIMKIAAIKTNQTINENIIADKIYKEVKNLDNQDFKKLLLLKKREKKKTETKIIKNILEALHY